METKELITKEDFNPLKDIKPTHALITSVDFSSGKKANIVTLFNCTDFSFEEVNIGVNTGISRQTGLGIIDRNSTLYKLENGILKQTIKF